MDNLELFESSTFTEFEEATAEQIATASGRSVPNENDMRQAVALCQKWNKDRHAAGLPHWQ